MEIPIYWPLRSSRNHVEDRLEANKEGAIKKKKEISERINDTDLKEDNGSLFRK